MASGALSSERGTVSHLSEQLKSMERGPRPPCEGLGYFCALRRLAHHPRAGSSVFGRYPPKTRPPPRGTSVTPPPTPFQDHLRCREPPWNRVRRQVEGSLLLPWSPLSERGARTRSTPATSPVFGVGCPAPKIGLGNGPDRRAPRTPELGRAHPAAKTQVRAYSKVEARAFPRSVNVHRTAPRWPGAALMGYLVLQ